MNLSKLQPLDDRVLILPDSLDETVKGFYMNDDNKPKKLIGTVVAVGTGVPLMNVKFDIKADLDANTVATVKDLIELIKQGRPMDLKIGNRVIYGQFAGTRVPIDNVEYLMIRRSDVFMVVND